MGEAPKITLSKLRDRDEESNYEPPQEYSLTASIALDHLPPAPPRVQYASTTEFLFSCISYSIG